MDQGFILITSPREKGRFSLSIPLLPKQRRLAVVTATHRCSRLRLFAGCAKLARQILQKWNAARMLKWLLSLWATCKALNPGYVVVLPVELAFVTRCRQDPVGVVQGSILVRWFSTSSPHYAAKLCSSGGAQYAAVQSSNRSTEIPGPKLQRDSKNT